MAARYPSDDDAMSWEPTDGLAMDKPEVFIATQGDGKMTVNQDIVQLLNRITSPVCVISIVGKYRTGKSYLMNRFFNTNAGFALGPTVQATTKGIWIWIRPLPTDPSKTLILLDTEGLHDAEKGDETHDMKLFSLALLLSSCLVYNATGALDDIIIKQLQLVSELTEHIRTKENKEEDGNHFNKYFPSFFLVLRDFFLRLEINDRPCSPDEYLEYALKLKVAHTKKARDYNEPRECIRAFFPRRRCFVLCKPVDDDEKLAHLDQVSDSEIKPKFLDAARSATQSILSDARPFEVDGHKINGPRYAQLALTYVKAINGGAVPCISSAVELLKNNECQRAMDEAASLFDATMSDLVKGKLPISDEEMTQAQKVARSQALEHYRRGALFDSEQTYISKLSETLDCISQSHTEQNHRASVEKCQALLLSLFKDIEARIQSGDYLGNGGYAKYKADREATQASYSASTDLGPQKENVLNEFLQARQAQEHAIIIADQALSEKEKQLAYETELREREQKRSKAAAAEQKRLMQQMIVQQEAHQEMLQKVQADCTDQQRKLLEAHNRDMLEKEGEHRRMLEEGLGKQAEQYQMIIGEIREDKLKLERDYKAQTEHMEMLSKNNQEVLSALKEQGEMSGEQMKALTTQLETLREQSEHSGSQGPAGAILGFFGKVVDTFLAFKLAGSTGLAAQAIGSAINSKK